MTVFRTLAAGAQLVLVVSLACVLLWFMALGFIVFTFLVPEETQAAVMGIATLTFLALVLIILVVTGAKGLWRWIGARRRGA